MNNKNFPPMMSAMMREAESANRKTWTGWGEGHKCENCGDWGFLSLVVAQRGPFNTPSTGKNSTFSEMRNGKVVWYEVKTYTFQCPDCQGGTRVTDDEYRPVKRKVEELAERWS
jgi:hypothetical protein